MILFTTAVMASPEHTSTINRYIQMHQQQKSRASLLFLQQAKHATLRASKKNERCYRLTLSDLNRGILYFSNQPKRVVGRIDNKRFIEIWNHNKIRPNIVLQGYYNQNGKKNEFKKVLVISQPRYNTSSANMKYQACLLNNSQPKLRNMVLNDATLFIDNFHPWP